jgi:hypothetical protein
MNSTAARLLFAAVGALVGFFAMKLLFGGGASLREELRAEIVQSAEMYAVMEEAYPEAFSELLDELVQTEGSADPQAAAFAIASERTAALRVREAPNALAAEDPLLQTYIEASADTIEGVLARFGETRCGQFGTLGASALGGDINDPAVFPLIDAQAAALLRALASGRAGDPRAAATAEDYAGVADQTALSDEEAARLQLVIAQGAGQDGYCEALAWYLRRIARSDAEGAERVRATLTRDLAAS